MIVQDDRSMGSSRVGFLVNLPSPAVDELEPEAIVERAMVAMAERGEVDTAAELPIASVPPSGSDRVRSGEQWR